MPRDDRWEDLLRLSDDDDEKGDIGIGVAHGRSSFSYYRLPEPLLKLSVLKLDGSSFDVQIERTASVRELKLAVEDVFGQSPEEGEAQISWYHVWSRFCLCYEGQKLVDDRASLQSLGIRDGDQLRFIRHISINYSPIKSRPRNHGAVLQKHRRSSTAPEVLEKIYENGKNNNGTKIGLCHYADEKSHKHEGNKDLVGHKMFKLGRFLQRWFSCTRPGSSGRTRKESRTHSSRSGGNCRRVIKGTLMNK